MRSEDGVVLCHVDGDVATLTLVRPTKHNAISDPMWTQLADHLRRLADDELVRVVVVRGSGSVFSSGADLGDLVAAAEDPAQAQAFCLRVATALHALATSSKLTVAALKHHVRGGGAEVALACDVRLGEEDVAFQIPVARLGVVPDRFTVRRLVGLAGPAVARRVLLLTHELDAADCHRVGLLDEVVPLGGLDEAVTRLVDDLRPNTASAVQTTKRMLLEEEDLLHDPEAMISEFVESLVGGTVAERGRRVLNRQRR